MLTGSLAHRFSARFQFLLHSGGKPCLSPVCPPSPRKKPDFRIAVKVVSSYLASLIDTLSQKWSRLKARLIDWQ